MPEQRHLARLFSSCPESVLPGCCPQRLAECSPGRVPISRKDICGTMVEDSVETTESPCGFIVYGMRSWDVRLDLVTPTQFPLGLVQQPQQHFLKWQQVQVEASAAAPR